MKKIYTLRYSKSGIIQYVDFFIENDILVKPEFNCAYQPINPLPKISECKTIKEVLSIISDYSYDKKCEIYMINYKPVGYNNSDQVNLKAIDTKIAELFKEFFKSSIKPLLPKNYKIKHGAFYIDETLLQDLTKYVKIYNRINYICYQFLYKLNIVKYYDFKPEVRKVKDYTYGILSMIKD